MPNFKFDGIREEFMQSILVKNVSIRDFYAELVSRYNRKELTNLPSMSTLYTWQREFYKGDRR